MIKIYRAIGLVVVLWAMLSGFPAQADFERYAFVSKTSIEFHVWPKLSPPNSWKHDRAASEGSGTYTLIPEGKTFAGTKTIIYGKATYRKAPKIASTLAEHIKEDLEHISGTHSAHISKETPLKIADGTELATYKIFVEDCGQREKVAYVEDGDFYVLLVLMSFDKEEFEGAIDDFDATVRAYTREPEKTKDRESQK